MTELGVTINEEYLGSLRQTIYKEFQNEKKHRPIERWEFNEYHGFEPESDINFAYIAGYTPGGAPYGVTWDEWEELED